MKIIGKKELTLTDRLAAYRAAGQAAVATFERAACDLEDAAVGLRNAAEDAYAQADALTWEANSAVNAAAKNENSARKIRDLLGV